MSLNFDDAVERFDDQKKELIQKWPELNDFLSLTAADFPAGGQLYQAMELVDLWSKPIQQFTNQDADILWALTNTVGETMNVDLRRRMRAATSRIIGSLGQAQSGE